MVAVLVLAGCQQELVDANGKPVASTEWVFLSADGISPVEGFQPLIRVKNGEFTGRLGCNHFNGTFRAGKETIEIHPGTRTEIACARPVLEREAQISSLFTAVNRYSINGSVLTLRTNDGKELKFFARIPKTSPPLEKTTWNLQSAAEGGMVGTSESIQDVRAVFTGDTVRLTHSCFELQASYVRKEEKVEFRVTSSSDRACGKPADRTANAKSMGTLLKESTRLIVSEDRLSLRSGSDPRLDFTAQSGSR